jgi:hypothetical protein
MADDRGFAGLSFNRQSMLAVTLWMYFFGDWFFTDWRQKCPIMAFFSNFDHYRRRFAAQIGDEGSTASVVLTASADGGTDGCWWSVAGASSILVQIVLQIPAIFYGCVFLSESYRLSLTFVAVVLQFCFLLHEFFISLN